MNIWFTSDTHFGHTNIAGPKISSWKEGYRNFNSVQEMNDALVRNINAVVGEDDILYHLGDWSFGGVHNIYYFRRALICKNIHLVLGNHDQHITDKVIKFHDTEFNPLNLFASVEQVTTQKIGKTGFHLSHYSHQVWPASHKGVIHLFGHSHGTIKGIGKSMDVGIDTHPEFRPYHMDEILKLMDRIPVSTVDHHTPSTNP
jgi:calcineurin-like phosphoesterase family protein